MELKLANGRKSIVHVNRLKPYNFGQDFFDEIQSPSPAQNSQPNDARKQLPSQEILIDSDQKWHHFLLNDLSDNEDLFIPFLPNDDIPQIVEMQVPQPLNNPLPKKRGRPKGKILKMREGLPPLQLDQI